MGSIPGLVQWVKDLPLPQLWRRSKLQLGFDPWPGGVAKKKKKKSKEVEFQGMVSEMLCAGRRGMAAFEGVRVTGRPGA